MRLFLRILKGAIGLLIVGALIFIPAGTLSYWQGWAFLAVFMASNIVILRYLVRKDPVLLERRRKVGPRAEKRFVQKIVMLLLFVIFLALIIFSILDWRFGWSNVPAWVSVLGDALVALGQMIHLRVFRENSFGASTIQKMEGQKVVSTGPYALVRHPMYVGVLVMTAGIPLALGSWWGLLFVLLMTLILIVRILDEEKMLFGELEGYDAYGRSVRYRLVPGVW
jgi:protein-S-isoprenylcysteine O-methyltransferase Ste14